jgi:hypothetical protein
LESWVDVALPSLLAPFAVAVVAQVGAAAPAEAFEGTVPVGIDSLNDLMETERFMSPLRRQEPSP